MTPRFIQIHTLTSYPASLLNRDDVGFAKRIPFGGAVRTRISSQCLKRHWRTFDGPFSMSETGVAPSVRSRLTFERFVVAPLVADGVPEAVARAVTERIMAEILGESAKAKEKKGRDEADETAAGSLRTNQVTVIGRPEVDYLLSLARDICGKAGKDPKSAAAALKEGLSKDVKENLRALRRGAGLDAALFGRMVTGDVLARGDAAVHVAHAMTVHSELVESDYFSAVDDLLTTGEDEALGSGHIGTTELTSGLFYGYVVIDVPLLVSNLEGCGRGDVEKADRALAADVARRFVHLVATVSPGAKLGSTAPHAYASMVMVETGDAQPRTLANAFLRPVTSRGDVLSETYRALARHLGELDAMYGTSTERRWAALGETEALAAALGSEPAPLAHVADWVSGKIGA